LVRFAVHPSELSHDDPSTRTMEAPFLAFESGFTSTK
jgi:hypothetical protein